MLRLRALGDHGVRADRKHCCVLPFLALLVANADRGAWDAPCCELCLTVQAVRQLLLAHYICHALHRGGTPGWC
jgi:hypothetical protein